MTLFLTLLLSVIPLLIGWFGLKSWGKKYPKYIFYLLFVIYAIAAIVFVYYGLIFYQNDN